MAVTEAVEAVAAAVAVAGKEPAPRGFIRPICRISPIGLISLICPRKVETAKAPLSEEGQRGFFCMLFVRAYFVRTFFTVPSVKRMMLMPFCGVESMRPSMA